MARREEVLLPLDVRRSGLLALLPALLRGHPARPMLLDAVLCCAEAACVADVAGAAELAAKVLAPLQSAPWRVAGHTGLLSAAREAAGGEVDGSG